jgi:hypothetical protein
MASNAPNAILAIDSLDRYIREGINSLAEPLTGSWTGTTELTIIDGEPVVGATIFSLGVGWPAGTTTIVGVVAQPQDGSFLVTISQTTTAPSVTFVSLTQTYTINSGAQPKTNILFGYFTNAEPHFNNFTISSPSALIYGYINKIMVSQVQLQYNIPTISLDRNDTFIIEWGVLPTINRETINILFGFYSPTELAVAITAQIAAIPALAPLDITVTYTAEDGFIFTSGTNVDFYFPSFNSLLNDFTYESLERIFRTCKTLGMTIVNSLFASTQASSMTPNFLYTPYIDIYSDVLTNYQSVKDTNSSISKPKGLIARVMLSGVGGPVNALIGTAPFLVISDMNTPKVIQWTRDVAVPSIDFQLRDCYGDLIAGVPEYRATEFQMTLLCVEDER